MDEKEARGPHRQPAHPLEESIPRIAAALGALELELAGLIAQAPSLKPLGTAQYYVAEAMAALGKAEIQRARMSRR